MFYQLHFFTLIVMGVCTVYSELWGIVGAMGYCRIYGVMSELWVIAHGYAQSYGLFSELWVILGTMGHVCFQTFPHISDGSMLFLSLLVEW